LPAVFAYKQFWAHMQQRSRMQREAFSEEVEGRAGLLLRYGDGGAKWFRWNNNATVE
jgi:hypothetical protein